MNIGTLIVLNLVSIPFISEAEILGCELKAFPTIGKILRLKNVLKTRWIKMYGIYLFIFIILSISPTASGKSYSAGYELIGLIIIVQIILWASVVSKIRAAKNEVKK